ncbi:hypothetical protein QR46_0260 [Giardia duodenalis assemblage B]|uniref:Uncharacterized protein n=3 Tax=Giardia intestinalis TaxID=5741 RepID=A0A132P026_GIAIN|nr:Hypothetical protein GL50581_4355 [Giardia intestinalis ATCC 50581]ESU44620.1 Hypothetical protein GSB_150983 [Giardia intestinalis]KWX15678.1 hypothetical protein QR46_0260 [Giardia intestinalis assemblage B]
MADVTVDDLRPCGTLTRAFLDTASVIKDRLISLEEPLAETLDMVGRTLGGVGQLLLPLAAVVVPLAVFQQ